jgi:hypothetical protein
MGTGKRAAVAINGCLNGDVYYFRWGRLNN